MVFIACISTYASWHRIPNTGNHIQFRARIRLTRIKDNINVVTAFFDKVTVTSKTYVHLKSI